MRLRTTAQILSCLTFLYGCTAADRSAELADTSDASIDEALTQAKASLVSPNVRKDLCLTSLDKEQANGSRLTLAPCDSSDAQLFRPSSNGSLVSQTGKCLDVVDGKDGNGTAVQLWACASNNINQKWETGYEGILKWKGKNRCLDVVDGKFEAGAKLQIWDCDTKNSNQMWRFFSPAGKVRSIESGTILAQINSFDAEPLRIPQTAGEAFPQSGPQSLGSLYKAGLCLDVRDIETTPYVWLYSCNNTRSQLFNFSTSGALQFPPVDVVDKNKNIIKPNSYCLATEDFGKDQGLVASIKPCEPDNDDQVWARSENAFVHMKSQKCLAIDAWGHTSNNRRYLPLADCTKSPAIRWSLGTKEDHERLVKKEYDALDIQSASKLWIQLIDRSGSSDELKSQLALYGGPEALIQWMSAQYEKTNLFLYSDRSQIPSTQILKFIIDRYPGGAYAMASSYKDVQGQIFLNFSYMKEKSKEQVLNTLAHEVTHISQYGYGVPSGFLEGLATYVADVTYRPMSKKSKGGSWKDGYEKTTHFLFWLDQNFVSSKDPRPFAIRMNLQAYASSLTQDKDWFLPWIRTETGQDIETLWANYQKSF